MCSWVRSRGDSAVVAAVVVRRFLGWVGYLSEEVLVRL